MHIAYQTVGDGPIDVLFIDQWWSNVDSQWDVPPLARMLERVASFSRLIVLDKRGTGLSDPVPLGGLPTLEEWMDDIRAVLDAVGSRRTALLSGIGASYLTILFAATYPERTAALVLVDGYARLRGADDYLPWLPRAFPPEEGENIRAGWVAASFSAGWLPTRRRIRRSSRRSRRTNGSRPAPVPDRRC